MHTLLASATFLTLLTTACTHDCGTDENASARRAAGPGFLECGRSYYGNTSCDPASAAIEARQCFLDAAKACKPAHFWRESPSPDGRLDEDLYVVPGAGGCKVHVVRQLTSDFCPNPVAICDSVTPTSWDGPAGKCPFATGVGCTGGSK